MSGGRKKTYTDNDINMAYSKILSLVESGETIIYAINTTNISSSIFYKRISQEQKTLLQEAKTANTIYGVGSTFTFSKK